MTAFNVVRFRVKAGRENEFLDAHRKAKTDWTGFQGAYLIQTAEHNFCIIGQWTDMDAMNNSMSRMVQVLDTFRDTLEDLGGGLGVTDPVSGPVVLEL